MPFKFENLEVWQLGLEYVDLMYELADRLPKSEEYNLKSQHVGAEITLFPQIINGLATTLRRTTRIFGR